MTGGFEMNTIAKKIACLLCVATLVSGCNMNTDKAKDNMDKAKDTAGDVANKTEDQMNDSIDNVMNYFTKKGIKYENSKALENIEFAAHEGRTFDVNGKSAYLYRVNTNDENMKKILKEAKEKGQIKVNINNQEQMYKAHVNNGYVLMYETSADMGDVVNVFPTYSINGN